jgi:hypothetical protein
MESIHSFSPFSFGLSLLFFCLFGAEIFLAAIAAAFFFWALEVGGKKRLAFAAGG